jgi:hypothetical protein
LPLAYAPFLSQLRIASAQLRIGGPFERVEAIAELDQFGVLQFRNPSCYFRVAHFRYCGQWCRYRFPVRGDMLSE